MVQEGNIWWPPMKQKFFSTCKFEQPIRPIQQKKVKIRMNRAVISIDILKYSLKITGSYWPKITRWDDKFLLLKQLHTSRLFARLRKCSSPIEALNPGVQSLNLSAKRLLNAVWVKQKRGFRWDSRECRHCDTKVKRRFWNGQRTQKRGHVMLILEWVLDSVRRLAESKKCWQQWERRQVEWYLSLQTKLRRWELPADLRAKLKS